MHLDFRNENSHNSNGYFPDVKTNVSSSSRQLNPREVPKTDIIAAEENLLEKLGLIHQLLSRSDNNHNQTDKNSTNLLDRVLEEVESIKHNPTLNPKNTECNISGHWLSDSAGGIFDLTGIDTSGSNVPIKRKSPTDNVHHGFMNLKDWSTMLTFPYSNSTQYIIVTGMNKRDKIVATFMGECRICRKREVLQGNWLIVSHSRDCESLGTTSKLISDVWRRDNIEKLKRKHYSIVNGKRHGQRHSKQETIGETEVSRAAVVPSTVENFPKRHKEGKTTPLHIKLH